MDDFTASIRVKQIASYPQVPNALPDDLVLVQRFGLGGPYIAMPLSELLGSALLNAPTPGSAASGGPIPGIALTWSAPLSWNQNWPVGQPGAGPEHILTAGDPGLPGFHMLSPLWVEGDISANGSVFGQAVYSAGAIVATVNWVNGIIASWGANSVASFNTRTGAVALTLDDIKLAGGAVAFDFRCQGTCLAPTHWNPENADDTIATCLFVQNAISFAFEDWIALQNPVLSFNGRGGNVVLSLADVSLANNSVPGSYPTAPTPPAADSSANIATTAFVAANVALGFLPLSGGTMTGPVTMSFPSPYVSLNAPVAGQNRTIYGLTNGVPRWQLNLGNVSGESGSNNGSNFTLQSYTDAGPLLATPLQIVRATGAASFTGGSMTVSAAAGLGTSFTINKSGAGFNNDIFGDSAGVHRWRMQMGESTAEGGSNTGSNFNLICYSDAGATLFTPIAINRAAGNVTLRGTSTNDSAAAGYVGEVIQAVVTTPVSLATGVTSTIGSIALTGGDWDVSGVVIFAPAGTTTVSAIAAGVNSIAATLPSLATVQNGLGTMLQLQSALTTGAQQTLDTGRSRIQVSSAASPATYYLVAQAGFGVSTCTATGFIGARRKR